MKVLAVNSSPKTTKSTTQILLGRFIDGMKSAGAEVDLLFTQDMDIKQCRGDYNCWFNTPGECIHRDDFTTEVIPLLRKAEIFVIATPVYVDGMSGQMKTFFDRCIATGDPRMILRDGHCRHLGREPREGGKLVLVSTCGFWEMDNFDPLVHHIEAISRNLNVSFVGALLRPHSAMVVYASQIGIDVSDILDACFDAGVELIEKGTISADILATISRPIVSLMDYVEGANRSIEIHMQKSRQGL